MIPRKAEFIAGIIQDVRGAAMGELRVRLSKQGQADLLAKLDHTGIDYVERHPPIGTIMASADAIDIINAVGALPFAAIAGVLVAWLHGRASRKVIIRTDNDQIVHLQGYSVEEAEKILRVAADVTAIQTEKDD